MQTCYNQLSLQFDFYLGSHLTDYFIYMVGEGLDTRTFLLLSFDNLFERVELVESQGLCTKYVKAGRNAPA